MTIKELIQKLKTSPFHLDNIRELTPDDRLQEQVKRWAGAKYLGPVNKKDVDHADTTPYI